MIKTDLPARITDLILVDRDRYERLDHGDCRQRMQTRPHRYEAATPCQSQEHQQLIGQVSANRHIRLQIVLCSLDCPLRDAIVLLRSHLASVDTIVEFHQLRRGVADRSAI